MKEWDQARWLSIYMLQSRPCTVCGCERPVHLLMCRCIAALVRTVAARNWPLRMCMEFYWAVQGGLRYGWPSPSDGAPLEVGRALVNHTAARSNECGPRIDLAHARPGPRFVTTIGRPDWVATGKLNSWTRPDTRTIRARHIHNSVHERQPLATSSSHLALSTTRLSGSHTGRWRWGKIVASVAVEAERRAKLITCVLPVGAPQRGALACLLAARVLQQTPQRLRLVWLCCSRVDRQTDNRRLEQKPAATEAHLELADWIACP